MPYIKQEDRPQFDKILNQITRINTKSELGYCIFTVMSEYMNGMIIEPSSIYANNTSNIILCEDMPGCYFVDTENKKQFDKLLYQLPGISSKGQLEYCIYKLLLIYMKDKEVRYSNLHDTVYVTIDCGNEFRKFFVKFETHINLTIIEKFKETIYACIHAGHEFQRMHLDKREDVAIQENGDVV